MMLVAYILMFFVNGISSVLISTDRISIGTYLIIVSINIFGFITCYILDKISDYMCTLTISIGSFIMHTENVKTLIEMKKYQEKYNIL
jgi:hypothetical protein